MRIQQRKEQRQRKIDFVTMLKSCVELTSRTRFQKVVSLFEGDVSNCRLQPRARNAVRFNPALAAQRLKPFAREDPSQHASRLNTLRDGRSLTSFGLPSGALSCEQARWQALDDELEREELFEEYARMQPPSPTYPPSPVQPPSPDMPSRTCRSSCSGT